MDLDDSFTDRLIHKRRVRQEYTNQTTKAEISSMSKKRTALVEEQKQNSEESPEESPKRQCTKPFQTMYSSHDKENIEMQDEDSDAAFIPIHSASKVRGLAALKKNFLNDDDEGSKMLSEQQVNKCSAYVYSTNSKDLCTTTTKQKSRFLNLAADIRQWEDDTHRPTFSSNNVASNNTKIQMPLTNTPNSTKSALSMKLYYTSSSTPSKINSSGKHVEQILDSHCNKHNLLTCAPSNSGLGAVSACKTGDIEVGIVGGKKKKLQAWDQAVAAALETTTSVKSPVKPFSKFSGNGLNQNSCDFNENSHQEENSNEEDMNEDDPTENYRDAESNQEHNRMVMNHSPAKLVEKQEMLPLRVSTVEKSKSAVLADSKESNLDPAELPLSARKALFEKALLGGTPKINETVIDQKLSVAQRAAMFENASKVNSRTRDTHFKEPNRITFSNIGKIDKSNAQLTNSPVKIAHAATKPYFEKNKDSPVKNPVSVATALSPSPSKNVGNHTRLIQQKLLEGSNSNSQEKEVAKAVEQRKQEISSLVNHWEKLCEKNVENNSEERNHLTSDERVSFESDMIPEDEADEKSEYDEAEVENESSGIDAEDNHDVETENSGINVEDNHDVETEKSDDDQQEEEEECEDEELDESENVFYTQENKIGSYRCARDNYNKEQDVDILLGNYTEEIYSKELDVDTVSSSSHQNYRSETSSISGISSYTDDSNYNASSSHSSSSSSARSDNLGNSTPKDAVKEAPIDRREKKNPEIPLLYTVSFYRKQKQETRLTPVRTIVRREKLSPESPPDVDYTEMIQKRLKALQEEILRQQTVISQTSQALNLCSATAEFSGSTEQVEGERLLLIATQKRQACLNEINRLKTCGAQGENVIDGTGTLMITDLQLPLKREFIASQLEGKGNDTVHYFLCLIRHGAQVIVTQMMSSEDKSSDGTLYFTNHIQLRDLPANFSVVFEVYALQTKKEFLPHEKKYHIKREHSKIRLTPKGKKSDGKILLPAISSPGGPNAVRSPSFGVVGFTRFTLQNCNKRTFTLDKVPFTSPLDGVLRVKLQLHAEHKIMEKGFLAMFEDVGGFGAWHRRWFALDSNQLLYWKYPDDEHNKEPIGTIDLRQCITSVVKLVSRDVCARPNTFQLVTVRPQEKGDKNTLISRSVNTLTTTKLLLSADTKEERILWCNKLNEALTNVRKWDPQALRPLEAKKE